MTNSATITMNMREVDPLKTVQAVVDRTTRVSQAAPQFLVFCLNSRRQATTTRATQNDLDPFGAVVLGITCIIVV
jgi:hypothetical protein